MPLSIGSLFSRGSTPKPEIAEPIVYRAEPIVYRAAPKNCTLISNTCNVDGFTVIN